MKKTLSLMVFALVAGAASAEDVDTVITCTAQSSSGKQVFIRQTVGAISESLRETSKLDVLVDGSRSESEFLYDSMSDVYVQPYQGDFVAMKMVNEGGEVVIDVRHVGRRNRANEMRVMKAVLSEDRDVPNPGELVKLSNLKCSVARGEL